MGGRFFYNLALFALLVSSLPKLFAKKHRRTFAARLGRHLPKSPFRAKRSPVIWIHAVSVGETRAIIPLFKRLYADYPDALIFLSNTTETGLAEAKQSLPEAAAHFLLPFDFSWTMRTLVHRLRPDLFILVESDFWLNLLDQVKRKGGRTLLINGKISERSAKRFRLVKPFARALFSRIDHFSVQSKRYQQRFLSLGAAPERVSVAGNVKLDFSPPVLSAGERLSAREALGVFASDCLIVAGSTHPGEEALILRALAPVFEKLPGTKLLLVPRHPERFSEVHALLLSAELPYGLYSAREQWTGGERVLLIDTMGMLNRCYALADLALVGGSFVAGIGGHNIIEPALVSLPVLFGPHMQAQQELVELVAGAGAGCQVTPENLSQEVFRLLADKSAAEQMRAAATYLIPSIRGATERTLKVIAKSLGLSTL